MVGSVEWQRIKNNPERLKKNNERHLKYYHKRMQDPDYHSKKNVYLLEYYHAHKNDPGFKKKKVGYRMKYLREAWEEVFKVYGRVCACCGESNPGFLTLDRINGDGKEDRAKFGYPIRLLREAAKHPDHEKYQILCFNCNCGRAFRGNGICPHKIVLSL